MDDIGIAARREVGTLPVSIGTALAFEAVFATKKQDHYNCILLNLRTLVRNYYSAFQVATALGIDPAEGAVVVLDELRTLVPLFNRATPVLYCSNYSDIESFLPGSAALEPFGEKRLMLAELEQQTIDAIIKTGSVKLQYFEGCRLDFTVKGKALMFSHCVTDLFSRYDFTELDLLESYTATIKDRSKWYTKLTNGKELTTMPFNKFTLAIFGDKSVYVKPQPIGLRRALLELSTTHRWSTITSMDKIREDIKKLPAGETRDMLSTIAARYL